ncbi:MAG: 16S rRNA (cytidine(1402)-2'-O)-methyltransferase [Desulfuromonadaceae bacterium]|nr:16S rRNA (cytidine(1402)-2'-O)-methyltransferase [Desulfuromonadaceae bacterium]
MSGTLYVVATPIGNLEDITLRALRILKEVDLIAAEDTRHSRKLLNHFAITTTMVAFHEHNERDKTANLIDQLTAGKSIALISDAGTPTIADPGYRLISAVRAAGLPVAAVPGPSAIIAALSVAGLPTDSFQFLGFLPAKASARSKVLEGLRGEQRTTVCYETPHRLLKALTDLHDILGPECEVVVVRELTKIHEEVVRGPVREVLTEFSAREKVRGEIVLLLGAAPVVVSADNWRESLRERLAAGAETPKQSVKFIAKEFGVPSDEVYRYVLALRNDE